MYNVINVYVLTNIITPLLGEHIVNVRIPTMAVTTK